MSRVEFYKEQIYKQAALNKDIQFNPLQKRVLNKKNNSLIVAHPVGSGKTLTGVAKFEQMKEQGKAHKALVVTPAGLRHNFATEGVAKFTNSKFNIIGNKQEVSKKTGNLVDPKADYNVISYEMFRRNPDKYIDESGADTIICDEFHRLRNEGTSTGKAFQAVKDRDMNFIGLTGSLVNNSPSDVQPLVDLIAKEHILGDSKREFDKTHIKRSNAAIYKNVPDHKKPMTGFKFPKLLGKELNKYVDYADIDDVRDIAKIPRKNVNTIEVPINDEQLKIYRGIIKNNPNIKKLIYQKRLETLKDDEIAKAFNDLIEARKLMNSIGSVVPHMSLQDSAKQTPKTKRLLDDLQYHLNSTPDGQAILLTNLIKGGEDTLEAGLKDRGISFGRFIGKGNKGITEQTRQQDINDYKNRKKRVMLISGAGAEGLSLGDTTWEGVLDPHYNPERMNQMEARGIRAFGLSHRKPKDREVQVNRYMATMPKFLGVFKKYPRKTPDEVIYEMAHNKDLQNKKLFELIKKYQDN